MWEIGPQEAVAGVMPECVVRLLEGTAVELDDADRPSIHCDPRDGLVPGEPVCQAREGVAASLVGGALEVFAKAVAGKRRCE